MCFVSVKEEEYVPPVREKVVRVRRIERSSFDQDRRLSAPRPPPSVRRSREFEESVRESRVSETREPSRAPSRHSTRAPSRAPTTVAPTIIAPSVVPSRAPTSVAPSRAPTTVAPPSEARTARSTSRSHYIEVDHESETESGSSTEEDVKSRATHRTSKSSRTAKSSKAPSTAPLTEYSIHEMEKEYRRSVSRPRNEWETYRYVNAPPSNSRDYDDGESVHRRITVEENRDGSRRRFEYRN